MALDKRSTTTGLIEQARHERERLRQAELWANEVLGRIASGQTAVLGTSQPPTIPETVVLDKSQYRIEVDCG